MDNLITTTELQKRCGYTTSTIIKKLQAQGYNPELVFVNGHICKAWPLEAETWLKNHIEEESKKSLLIIDYAKELNVSVDLFRAAMKNIGLNAEYRTNRSEVLEQEVKKLVEEDKQAMYESHPLVTDKRCFRLSWWPDVVPKCFEDLDEDII